MNSFTVNVDMDSSASIGVQNRRDEGGAIVHYVVIKPGPVQNVQTERGLHFKIDHNSIIALTSSLSVAYQNNTVTGSF